MKYSKTEEKLMAEMQQMEIIDCHEHLPPEKVRTDTPQDVFTLVGHYTRHDLFSAGMDWDTAKDLEPFSQDRPVYQSLFDYEIPLEKRWKTLKPYWEAIRYGSYAKSALLTAKMVYGFDDINDETYQPLSEAIAAENTPGIYKRILCDKCNIRASMTQCQRTDVDYPLVPVMPGMKLMPIRQREQIEGLADEIGAAFPKTLDDYLSLMQSFLKKWIDEGTIGIKIMSKMNLPPDRQEAERAYTKLLDGEELIEDPQTAFEVLENFLLHNIIDQATELDLVVAVHAGIWRDFRKIDSKHILTLAAAHPRSRFDLYHLGSPSVRDTIVIAKNLPNVFLNLCWTHIISQVQTRSGIDELLDQVPVNKILAFGGDYGRPVEKVVGHLQMAREDFAKVFGARIDSGGMSFDEAIGILKLWFWDNPLKLYTKLKV